MIPILHILTKLAVHHHVMMFVELHVHKIAILLSKVVSKKPLYYKYCFIDSVKKLSSTKHPTSTCKLQIKVRYCIMLPK